MSEPNNGDTILPYLQGYQMMHGWMPTLREIAEGCHLPQTVVNYWLEKRTQAGKITRERNKARCIRIVEAPF